MASVKDRKLKRNKARRESGKEISGRLLERRSDITSHTGAAQSVLSRPRPAFSLPREARYLLREARKESLTAAETAALDTVERLLSGESGPNAPHTSLETQVFDVQEPWMTTISCELYLALCKKSKKYASLVSKLKGHGGLLIGAIGMAVASAVGFAIGAVAALVATMLALISKIGLEAWCKRMTASRKCEGVV
jgi:hypothetical protein